MSEEEVRESALSSGDPASAMPTRRIAQRLSTAEARHERAWLDVIL
jgi:hypothetical protein